MRVIAIIPARGGSKGVPGKNKMIINGLPLITYSIETALRSELIDEIIVSTDDPDIVKISNKFKVLIHERSPQLSTDTSKVSDLVTDIMKTINSSENVLIVLLQPTSPLRTPIEIDKAIELMKENTSYNSLISLIQVEDKHPARMYEFINDVSIKSLMPEFETYRRQDLPKYYQRNGALYIYRYIVDEDCMDLMKKPSIGYIMNSEKELNIDTEIDCLIAPHLIKKYYE